MESFPQPSPAARVWGGRALQAAFNGSTAFVVPFLGLFYQRAGLSGVEIGALLALGALTALSTAPLWGTLADRTARPVRAAQAALVGASLGSLFLGRQTTFTGIAAGTALYTACLSGAWPLVDLISFAQVRGTRTGFGAVRLGGSLGWMAVVWPAGWWVERAGLGVGFLAASAAYLLTALLASRLRIPDRQGVAPVLGPGFFHTLRHAPPLLLMASGLLIFGAGFTGPKQFMAIYIHDLGGSEGMVGLASGLGALFEWPFMLLADRLTARHRPRLVLRLGLLTFAFGWAAAAVVPNALWYLPARIIVSAAYSFYIVGLVSTVSRRVTVETSATAIAFFVVTLTAVADLAGGPIAGWSYDLGGGRALHWVSAGLGLLASVVLLRLPPAEVEAVVPGDPRASHALPEPLTSDAWH
ncbi:MAG: hypothetical protein A2Y93_15420 [Chloroflexi bacterium RBG_13_68_17]|nr:MAG: hypothetical protein A2Y93_15420 [Chloroflexi bacterium RBG_13_68_17]